MAEICYMGRETRETFAGYGHRCGAEPSAHRTCVIADHLTADHHGVSHIRRHIR